MTTRSSLQRINLGPANSYRKTYINTKRVFDKLERAFQYLNIIRYAIITSNSFCCNIILNTNLYVI